MRPFFKNQATTYMQQMITSRPDPPPVVLQIFLAWKEERFFWPQKKNVAHAVLLLGKKVWKKLSYKHIIKTHFQGIFFLSLSSDPGVVLLVCCTLLEGLICISWSQLTLHFNLFKKRKTKLWLMWCAYISFCWIIRSSLQCMPCGLTHSSLNLKPFHGQFILHNVFQLYTLE